eukprot:g37977.t1
MNLHSGRYQQHTRASGESGVRVEWMAITKEKMLGKLKVLEVDKSPGAEGLYPRFWKDKAEEIIEALVVIFQESLESGKIPEEWKMVNCTPGHQKSVTNSAIKQHLLRNDLLSDSQFEFHQGYSAPGFITALNERAEFR